MTERTYPFQLAELRYDGSALSFHITDHTASHYAADDAPNKRKYAERLVSDVFVTCKDPDVDPRRARVIQMRQFHEMEQAVRVICVNGTVTARTLLLRHRTGDEYQRHLDTLVPYMRRALETYLTVERASAIKQRDHYANRVELTTTLLTALRNEPPL